MAGPWSTTRLRRRGHRPDGYRERERRALADRALDPDPPAVELDEPLRQGEPEAGPLARAFAGSSNLLKLLEDLSEILWGDADAAVADRHLDLAISSARAHGDRAAIRGELHGVRQQVEEDLADLALVGDDRAEVGR